MCAKPFLLFSLLLAVFSRPVSAATPPDVTAWPPDTVLSAALVARWGVDAFFVERSVPTAVFALMQGRSYGAHCPVPCAHLRYLRLLHVDERGRLLLGEMVCHRRVARQLRQIFRRLYVGRYPIERMVLIDHYDANDERSMRANNTSCFCYRPVAGQKRLSAHAYGLAVDVNPLYNPAVRWRGRRLQVQPATAAPYARRTARFAYKIEPRDLCHRLFVDAGFAWGGAWRSLKDYQHFEWRHTAR